jgi:hypothetical protein
MTARVGVLAMFAYIGAIGFADMVRSILGAKPTPIALESWTPSLLGQHVAFEAEPMPEEGKGVVEESTSRSGTKSIKSDLIYVPAMGRGGGKIWLEFNRRDSEAFVKAIQASDHFEGLARGLESEPAGIIGVPAGTAVVRWQARPHDPITSLFIGLFGLCCAGLLLGGAFMERAWAERHELAPKSSMDTVHGGFALMQPIVAGVGVYWMYDYLSWKPDSVAVTVVSLVFIALFAAMSLTRAGRFGYGTTELRIARPTTGVELSIPWTRVSDLDLKSSFVSKNHVNCEVSLTTGEKISVLLFGRAAEAADQAQKSQLWRPRPPTP